MLGASGRFKVNQRRLTFGLRHYAELAVIPIEIDRCMECISCGNSGRHCSGVEDVMDINPEIVAAAVAVAGMLVCLSTLSLPYPSPNSFEGSITLPGAGGH